MQEREDDHISMVLLGGLRLSRSDGSLLAVMGRKGPALLAYLALSPGMSASREKLADVFWSDRDNEHARNSLRQTLTVLRRELGDLASTLLSATTDSLSLKRNRVTCDVLSFREAAAGSSLSQREAAAAMFVGPFLDGFFSGSPEFDAWAAEERERLTAEAIDLMEGLAQELPPDQAIKYSRRLIALDPTREASHRLKIQILQQQGHYDLALRQYDICRDILQKELGVSPSPETEEVRQALLLRPTPGSQEAEAIAGSDESQTDILRPVELPLADTSRWKLPRPILAITGTLLAFMIAGIWWWSRPPKTDNAAPVVAILPFANASNEASFDYFADGLTFDITTNLSRSPLVQVISGGTPLGNDVSGSEIRKISKELGAQYVLKGNVARSGDKIRIAAQLVNGDSGRNVWAEQFDQVTDDPLAIQNELSSRVVAELGGAEGSIVRHQYEKAWGQSSSELAEYDYALRGHQLFKRLTKEDTERAIQIWLEGLRSFPGSSLLYAHLAWGEFQMAYGGWAQDYEKQYQRMAKYAIQALEQPDAPPEARMKAYWALTYFYLESAKDVRKALQTRDALLAMTPGDPAIVSNMAVLTTTAGRPDEAIAMAMPFINRMGEYVWTSPRFAVGRAYFAKADYEQAIEYLSLAPPDAASSTPMLAAALAEVGRASEARSTLSLALKDLPDLTIKYLDSQFPNVNPNVLERQRAAFRKAGVPEG